MTKSHPHPTPARTKHGPIVYSDEQMLEILRQLAGEDRAMSRPTYAKRRGTHHPAPALFEMRFGSWNKALATAGLLTTSQPAQLTESCAKWSLEQMIQAIIDCADQTGSTTLRAYEAWRTNPDRRTTQACETPPAMTIRARFGSWAVATARAFPPQSTTTKAS